MRRLACAELQTLEDGGAALRDPFKTPLEALRDPRETVKLGAALADLLLEKAEVEVPLDQAGSSTSVPAGVARWTRSTCLRAWTWPMVASCG